ncbi:hypothetical protein EPUL_003195 [Erysiphe pulchra]|uniref:Tim44-like domain-containing protein n=1 Tax=Erysiphe pulchra TaxID=225359 RepID=A0A2S4PNS3_9PEZI|nr:hypothetical protein EPUL_003195 [Erysiphe pulchra]
MKQKSDEVGYLKGARAAERSIRLMSKENSKMPLDIGLLEKTFITPTGPNRPSIFKSPLSVLAIERTRLVSRFRDIVSVLLCKFTSPKATSFWDRTFNLNRSSIVPTATALHRQMYTAFAEGDDQTLRNICLDGILDNFRNRIANRPREEKVTWELIKYNKNPKLVSNRAAKTPINGMLLRQAVVQICSRQKLTRYNKVKGSTQLELIQGSGKEKDVVEYLVIQRIYEQWQPNNWMVWGTAQETSLEDLEEWKKV